MLPAGNYIVFSVESGDRLNLLVPSKEASALPTVKGILLSHVKVPRPGRGGAEDEPCAFEAMEAIRDRVIGKSIKFYPDYHVDPLQRTAGRVVMSDGEDCAALLVSLGLAIVSENNPSKIDEDREAMLRNRQKDAKDNRRGLYQKGAECCIRPVLPFPPADIESFAAMLKGTVTKVRVDRVQSPSVLFCTMLDTHQSFLLHFTGVLNPQRGDNAKMNLVVDEAKFFVEKMLLNRHVNIKFEGTDAYLNMLGSIIGKKGAFQQELASRGYVRVSPGTISNSDLHAEIRQCEKDAQAKKAGMWFDYTPVQTVVAPVVGEAVEAVGPRNDFEGSADFEATVMQVISGDLLLIKRHHCSNPYDYIKISLSGVRTNKSHKDQSKSSETRVTYDGYSWEAKELLRKYVGKTVDVHIDYTRTIEGSKEIRPSATVVDQLTLVNLGASVVEAGYARFFLGKTDCCMGKELLEDAESRAKARELGIHGSKDSEAVHVVEMSRLGEAGGKNILSFLQRGMVGHRPPTLKGVVEMVMSGSAFRVHIPKEHFQIPLKLAGVMSPLGAGPGSPAEDSFYKESRDYAMTLLQQKDVEIAVDASDRGGNFIGSLHIGGNNFAVMLVEAGFAVLANADRVPYYNALLTAEEAAKAAKKGIWSTPNALPARYIQMQSAMKESGAPVKATYDASLWRKATLADVVDATTVTMLFDSSSSKKKDIDEACKSLSDGSAHHANPSKGEMVVAMFKEDRTWNRAKVSKVNSSDTIDVIFIDFGNTVYKVDAKCVKKIPSEADYAFLKTTPPLATTVKLAGVRNLSLDHEYSGACCDAIWAYSEQADPDLWAKCDYTVGDMGYYTIRYSNDDTTETLGEALLREGVAVMDKRIILNRMAGFDPKMADKLKAAQEIAHKEHVNMWKYGDAGIDEE
eukprot:Tbor_TRINITY_DN3402_c0_g1::TRINITY_DN3402_c0_g1_i1::g.3748::m.3748/K15979/SND1; staphylococcal nuclease domain-containing protein 1